MEVRDSVLKSLETARKEKLIGAPLEARVTLSANGDLFPLLEQYAARIAGPVHRVAGGCCATTRRSEATSDVTVERAAGTKVRALLEVHHDVGSDPRFPTVCAACAGAVDETLNG